MDPGGRIDKRSNWFSDFLNSGIDPATVSASFLRQVRTLNLCTALIVLVGVPFVFQYLRMGVSVVSAGVVIAITLGIANLKFQPRVGKKHRNFKAMP